MEGTEATYPGPVLYLYRLHLSAAPDMAAWVDSWAGHGNRKAPFEECPWWVCLNNPRAHWPNRPGLRSSPKTVPQADLDWLALNP